MAKDNMIFVSFRLNINNPQHVKINSVLKNLNPDIYKSKNQFVADAVEYYIDHFGKDDFTTPDEKKKKAYVTKAELELIKNEMIENAVTEARNEVIRVLGGVVSGMQTVVTMRPTEIIAKSKEVGKQEELVEDKVVSDLVRDWM